MILHLPWPPSMNHYWRTRVVGTAKTAFASTYISKEGKAFQEAVIEAVAAAGHSEAMIDGRLCVSIRLHQPDRRKCDIDNRIKPLLDALTAARIWNDDSQVDRLRVDRGEIRKGAPCCVVDVRKIERLPFAASE